MTTRSALAAGLLVASAGAFAQGARAPSAAAAASAEASIPAWPGVQTVHFPSADGRTPLVAYLFEPAGAGPHPAIVLLHGRGGPYSSRVKADCTLVGAGAASPCDASTLSRRHAMWAQAWAAHGYVALLVDSFGPRGRAHGYGPHTHGDPDRAAVDERTVRPLDAEGALAWLASRRDVLADRIVLQGWSNGGSTVLNAMQRQAERPPSKVLRFRAALAFYPGCGPAALLGRRVDLDAPLWVFLAGADEEVSPTVCASVLARSPAALVDVRTYDGATHDFDDPGTVRQAVDANRRAKADAMARAFADVDGLR